MGRYSNRWGRGATVFHGNVLWGGGRGEEDKWGGRAFA
jgi:hypothetical protein